MVWFDCVDNAGGKPVWVINRARAILLKPESEWRVIADEPTSIMTLFKNYAFGLALIPIVAGTIGSMMMSELIQQISIGAVSPLSVLTNMVLDYASGLVAIFTVAYIVHMVTPSFNGRQDLVQSVKLVIYAMTAFWLACLFLLIPPLGGLAMLAGISYAFYLIYLGSEPVLGIPPDKVAGFSVVFILISLVVGFILFLLRTAVSGINAPMVM
jgi:Yip1 domain